MAKKGRLPINGWINLNKPSGIGSTQALAKVKRALNPKKAGHAGTLDPLANGVLPIALGEATKTVPYMQDRSKIYRFTARWGEARDTDDSEGSVTQTSDVRPSEDAIKNILSHFVGTITQVPPRYSAVKIDGKRAYDLARQGDDNFEIKSRIVNVQSLEIESVKPNEATFLCHCGKGTYIRSIARDMAIRLGTFGHVTLLERQKVGPMSLDSAISLDFFDEKHDKDALNAVLLPVETVLDDIPGMPLQISELQDLRQGRVLTLSSVPDVRRLEDAGLTANIRKACIISLIDPDGKTQGLGMIDGVKIKPERLFNL